MNAHVNPPPRPTAFQGDLTNLPEALVPLKAKPNWVCWKWKWKINKRGEGKWDKPPFNPARPHDYAKNNEPTTWGTYEQALAAYQRGECDGIGFNLSGTDIKAFDLDDCRDPATGAIAPEAMKIVDRASSYTECTVSGTGLRVIGNGSSGEKVHRRQKIPNSSVEVESYRNAERYIVVTGNPLPNTWPHMSEFNSVMDEVVAELDGKPNAHSKSAEADFDFDGTQEQRKSSDDAGADSTFSRMTPPEALQNLIFNGPGPNDDHSGVFHHAVCWLGELGWSATRIEAFIAGKPIVPERFNGRLQKEIERCLGKAKPKQEAGNGAGNEQKTDGASATGGEPAADPVDLWAKFDPPTLPRGLLPDVIERFAFDQGVDMGADMAGVAMAALAVCAAAIPDKVKLQVKQHNQGWLESARLWVALIGPPSTKKSPIMRAALWPLQRLDAELARQYNDARAVYDGLSKEEKKQTQPPKHIRLMLQDTTMEAAQEILKDSPDGLLCSQDELTGWFGSMDKYSSGRGAAKDRAFWLEAFNGGSSSVTRISRGSVFIPNLSVSLLGGIQPEPIRKIAGESVDDGLLQRLLPVVLKPAAVGRDEPASGVVREYSDLIGRLRSLGSALLGGGKTILRFDDGAQRYRRELEQKHLELQNVEAISAKLSAHVGKYDGIFARLCVLWHCIESPPGGLPTVIPETTARRVGAFMHDFLLPHAMAFYAGTLGLSDQHERLASVAGYILAHKLAGLTNRDIQRGDRTMRNLDKTSIEEVFSALDTLGWITCVQGPRSNSSTHGVVNPVVHVKFAEKAKSEAERRARERKIIAQMARRGA